MTHDVEQTDLREQTRQLLSGPLKHVKAAGLAAALVPLAVVATHAAEPRFCASGGTICGVVWMDTNNNGVREAGEPFIAGANLTTTVVDEYGGTTTVTVETDQNGYYQFSVSLATYQVNAQVPPGTQVVPADVGDDSLDSDGVADGLGNSVAVVVLTEEVPGNATTDFGFYAPPVAQPGTGTPGYWKNHPEAWPVQSLTLGGRVYSLEEALALLEKPGKDKALTMFSSLASAKLNLLVGNDDSCVASTMAAADEWMATYGFTNGPVAASSYAWKIGEPLHRLMDNYNNGMLCVPHRE
jgi:hypothetical protein